MTIQPKNRSVLEAQSEALKQTCLIRERSRNPVIKANRLAYVILQRPNMEAAAKFFVDFGLLIDRLERDTIYFRGKITDGIILVLKRGPHKYVGFGVEASVSDLKTLSKATGQAIQERDDPLGGSFVELTDPDGLEVQVCNGLKSLEKVDVEIERPQWNGTDNKPRQGETVRTEITPHIVNKLGHTVISASKIKDTIEWYQDHLGMIVSDFQFVKDDPLPVVGFARFDLGDELTDHHSLGIGGAIEVGHVHTAFEVETMEDIAIGGEWLRRQGYAHSWGIGRHILGSQIFDYWREPGGEHFEHYADGDIFDQSVPAGYHYFTSKAQHQWGPELNKEFTGENRFGPIIKSLFKRLPSDDDLTIGRIKRMIKAVKS